MANRNYTLLPVNEVTNEELLLELLSRQKLNIAPIKKQFHTIHSEAIIGIGKDDVAYIQLDNDSLVVLKNLVRESNLGIK